jgi:hypothetical protein
MRWVPSNVNYRLLECRAVNTFEKGFEKRELDPDDEPIKRPVKKAKRKSGNERQATVENTDETRISAKEKFLHLGSLSVKIRVSLWLISS